LAGNITGSGVILTTGGGNSSTLGVGATNTYFTGAVTVGTLNAVSYGNNGQTYTSNPTTTFNGSSSLTGTNANVSRGNLVFGGNSVVNLTGSIHLTGDWAKYIQSGSTNVTCSSLNMSDGVTGSFNLGGGTLTTGSIYGIDIEQTNYTNQCLLNGVTLVPTGNNSSFLNVNGGSAFTGYGLVLVGTGGVTFNTSTYSIGTSTALYPASTGGSLTETGSGSLTMSGTNTITGPFNISSGTFIAANGVNSATPNGGALGAPNSTHTVTVGSLGTLNFNVSNVLGNTSNTAIATTLLINGGLVNNAASTSNTLGVVNLSGGTINASGGNFYFRQPVNIVGSAASTLASSSGGAFNLLSSSAGGTTFNVASTGALGGDLLVTGTLTNTPNGVGGLLVKSGPGTMVLSGSNTYAYGTNVSAGTLTFSNASAFPSGTVLINNGTVNFGAPATVSTLSGGSTGVTNLTGGLTVTSGGTYSGSILGSGSTVNVSGGSLVLASGASLGTGVNLNVGSGSTLSMLDGATGTLNVGGNFSINAASLSFDLGNSITNDKLAIAGTASVTGTDTINLNLITGQTLSNGTYTLITAAGGLSGASFTLGTVPAGFSSYNLSNTSTAETLTVTAKAPVPLLYWTGNASANGSPSDPNNNWGYGSALSTVQSNWSNVSSGSVDALNVPGSITDVYFTATNAIASSGTLSTQLDGSYAIKGLFIATPSNTGITSVGINTNTSGNSLAIGSDGLTVTSTSNAGLTISGPGAVVVNGSQSWANNSTLPLNISTGVSAYSGATTLTLNGNGSGGVTLGGTISNGGGTLALVLGQTGTTTISGSNTFTGGVTLNAGTIVLGSASAFNSTVPNAVSFGSGSTADLQLGGNNLTVASLNTNSVTAGSPIIENANGTAATLTVKMPSGTNTYAGTVQDGSGGGALSVATSGSGTLNLSGPLTYSGTTTVGAGSTLEQSGTVSTTGNVTIGNGATLILAGNSTATGSITLAQNNSYSSTLELIANTANTTGSGPTASSSAIGQPTALLYGNDASTTNIILRGDSTVTFANSLPTGGTGGYPDGSTINFDVNTSSGTNTTTPTTLALGSTTGGATGFATYRTTINVTGGSNYTLQIPSINEAYGVTLNLNASTASLSIPGGVADIGTFNVTTGSAMTTTLGVVAGAGPVNKFGPGTLVLTGSNTYTGSTNIAAGTLAVASTGSIASAGTINIASGAKFDVSANPNFTLASGAILGGSGTIVGPYTHSAGNLDPGGNGSIGTLAETGTLTLAGGVVNFDLSGSNASTGGTTNDLIAVTGNLVLNGTTPINVNMLGTTTVPSGSIYTVLTYTGSLSNASGGSLSLPSDLYQILPLSSTPGKVEIEYSTSTVQTLVWQGNVNGNWDVATTPNWVSSGNSALFNNADNVTFNDSTGVQNTNVSLATNVSPGSITVNSSAGGNNYTFSGPGSITGATGLNKLGTSTLTINSSNTYTGTTNISGGTVIVTNTTGSGIGTGPVIIGAGATLQVGDGGADGAIQNGNIDTNTITDNGVLAFNSSSTNLNPPMLITGTGSLFINASIGIGYHNTYTGPTTIAGGNVIAYESDSFGTTGLVTVNGGTLNVQYGADFANNFNLSGNALSNYNYGGTGVLEIDGLVNLTGDTTVQDANNAGTTFGNTVTSTGANLILAAGGNGVTFEKSVSLGTGQIETSTTVILAPAASTTLTVSSAITGSGSVLHTGAGTSVLSGSNTYSGGTNVSAGTLVLASGAAFPASSNLTVASGATVQIANHATGAMASLVVVGLPTNNGTIDITNNAMDIQTISTGVSDIGTITAEVKTAYNGGHWNGTSGITSSLAASDPKHLTAVGVATGLSSFENVSVSSSDVLVKYTYYGDANLDGQVNSSDYTLIDAGYLSGGTLTGWQNGDFNYDGVINGSDYTLIDNAFNTQGAQFLSQIASPTSQVAGTGTSSAVPEPATLGLLAFGTAALLGRRRLRHTSKSH
jgi:autotransporter-associated beta strand protein